MPAFIKTPADEHKWNSIKHSVAKQKGKNVADFTGDDWAEVNGIFHKNEELSKSISTKIPSTSVPNPSRVGSTAVKMPKAKKMPDAFGKASLFFKNEELGTAKHTSIEKLRDFLKYISAKRQSYK